jgi:hypothetical protein
LPGYDMFLELFLHRQHSLSWAEGCQQNLVALRHWCTATVPTSDFLSLMAARLSVTDEVAVWCRFLIWQLHLFAISIVRSSIPSEISRR